MTATERIRGRALQEIRDRILNRDNGLCVACWENKKATVATVVDHIVPLEAGGIEADWNRQALCDDCHHAKTQQESAGQAVSETPQYLRNEHGKTINVVTGPPYGRPIIRDAEFNPGNVDCCSVDGITLELFGVPYHYGLTHGQRSCVMRARNRIMARWLAQDNRREIVLFTPGRTYRERLFWQRLGGKVAEWEGDPDGAILRARKDDLDPDVLRSITHDIRTWWQ